LIKKTLDNSYPISEKDCHLKTIVANLGSVNSNLYLKRRKLLQSMKNKEEKKAAHMKENPKARITTPNHQPPRYFRHTRINHFNYNAFSSFI